LKIWQENETALKYDKRTLQKDLRAVMTSSLILLRMSNISDKSCRKHKKDAFFVDKLFPEERAV